METTTNDWTSEVLGKLRSILESKNLSLITTFPVHSVLGLPPNTIIPVVHCLRPLWTRDEFPNVNVDELTLCMEVVSSICENYHLCPETEIRWRELYALYALWQGEDSSNIVGGVWIGASMLLSDDEFAYKHASEMLIPLLFNTNMQPADWDRALEETIALFVQRGGCNSIFGRRHETKIPPTVTSVAIFRSSFVSKIFPETAVPETFLSTLSKLVETDSQAK